MIVKRLRMISILALLSLSLVACSQKAEEPAAAAEGNTATKKTEATTAEKENAATTEETNEEEETETLSLREKMSASDYIALVELSTTADNQMELRILNNYKGNLSNIEFEAPEGLSPSKQYVLFYHDGEDGNIEPTTEKDSIVEVSGSDDEILQSLQNTYGSKDSGNSNSSSTQRSSTTKTNNTEENSTRSNSEDEQ